MKNGMPEHYWRIHAKVTRRVWSDLPEHVRHEIAQDSSHTSENYKWFETKVNADTDRLFQDPDYYDNQEFSFREGNYAVEPTPSRPAKQNRKR